MTASLDLSENQDSCIVKNNRPQTDSAEKWRVVMTIKDFFKQNAKSFDDVSFVYFQSRKASSWLKITSPMMFTFQSACDALLAWGIDPEKCDYISHRTGWETAPCANSPHKSLWVSFEVL